MVCTSYFLNVFFVEFGKKQVELLFINGFVGVSVSHIVNKVIHFKILVMSCLCVSRIEIEISNECRIQIDIRVN
jgi:hypothetical protein